MNKIKLYREAAKELAKIRLASDEVTEEEISTYMIIVLESVALFDKAKKSFGFISSGASGN